MARSLNGSSQYFHASTAVATAPPIAMSCWFWADPMIAQEGVLVALTRANPGLDRFELRVDNSPLVVEALTRDSSSFSMATSTTNYTTGAWHHAFGVWYSSTDRQVWLDGGGHGTNGASRVAVSIAETCVGASRVAAPFSHFKGRIAEAAIWAGSDVSGLGAAEASMLATGLSPLCLMKWLPNLVMYQDLIRLTNRSGIGPALTEASAPGVAEHPRVILPLSRPVGLMRRYTYPAPYSPRESLIHGSGTTLGQTAIRGAEIGQAG